MIPQGNAIHSIGDILYSMVQFDASDDTIDRLLDKQKKQTEERRKKRELAHISESQLIEPAKRTLESEYLPNDGITTWYEEPSLITETPKKNIPIQAGAERADLICEWKYDDTPGTSTLYVIELKKQLNKQAIGQLITYYWLTRTGNQIKDGDKVYDIEGNELIVMMIGAIEYKKVYYRDLMEWIGENLDLGNNAGIELLSLRPD